LWEGTLDAGQKLRLGLTISKKADGTYTGSVDSIDQGAVIPIDVITVNGDSVKLELKSVGAEFDGKLNADATELTGQFSQSGAVLPLTFKRTQTATPAASPTPTATPSPPPRPIDVPVDVRIPAQPAIFKGGGKTHIAYELHITNFSRSACVFTRLEVVEPGAKKQLASYTGEELGSRIVRPGVVATSTEDRLKLAAGLRMVVHMWLTFDVASAAPPAVQHNLSFKVGEYPEELSVGAATATVSKAPIVISPPLRGSEWLAGNGPGNSSGHRRALIPTGGGARIAQRFAIDFVQLFPDGRSFAGDQKENKSYRCYGAEALAVADAVVVATKDGIPENIPGPTSRAVPITLETVGGNYVIMDLGGGRFAFYAHLQPGTLRVKTGDKVRRGQVVGLVGNSGNSTEPHLHFHISDGNSPLGSEGVPYAFPLFEVQGKGWGWKPSSPAAPTEKRQNEIPLENEVVRFP
jgi:murein DD-endopeptidase MepM/ murein hydrolase activator NlpD